MTAEGTDLPAYDDDLHRALRGGADAAAQLAELTDEIVRLRRAVEATTDFVTFHTRTGRVLFANGAARAAIGLSVGEPLPKVGIHDSSSRRRNRSRRSAPHSRSSAGGPAS